MQEYLHLSPRAYEPLHVLVEWRGAIAAVVTVQVLAPQGCAPQHRIPVAAICCGVMPNCKTAASIADTHFCPSEHNLMTLLCCTVPPAIKVGASAVAAAQQLLPSLTPANRTIPRTLQSVASTLFLRYSMHANMKSKKDTGSVDRHSAPPSALRGLIVCRNRPVAPVLPRAAHAPRRSHR